MKFRKKDAKCAQQRTTSAKTKSTHTHSLAHREKNVQFHFYSACVYVCLTVFAVSCNAYFILFYCMKRALESGQSVWVYQTKMGFPTIQFGFKWQPLFVYIKKDTCQLLLLHLCPYKYPHSQTHTNTRTPR